MRALVTGSAGFIGRHFAARLVQDGHHVVGCDPAHLPHLTWCGDCRRIFARDDNGYDLLVHCAAVIGSRQERDDNPMAVYENLALDQMAIAWCLRTRTPLLYFSSSATYPTNMRGPFRETDVDVAENIIRPDAAYGFIKLVGERQCRELKAAGVPVYVVRPFSGYGTDQSADYPFPAIIERVRQREDPLVIWSDTERDFIHVDDVVGACMAMIAVAYIPGPVNIGTGIPTRMSALARLAADIAGYDPSIKSLGKSAGPDHRFADISLMKNFYLPTITLDQGITEALKEPPS